ncbi:hypothetical protein C8Q74DRAFT_1255600 [Fomes fomentarius]|nr:hypothetical protein C8Q74DRAFT_1255600 [Fomes fomentarius]
MNMEAGPSAPHEIRITNHGKINHWVTVALEYLQKYEDGRLMLHTLPGGKGKGPGCEQSEERVAEAATETARAGKNGKPERMHPCMSTIPRLVSVVEIIKREYLKTLDATEAEGGTLSGLHQYNEIGELEEGGKAGNEEEGRLESLARALQGRNHVQQKKIAFMRITLCRKKLPELPGKAATYQAPSVRRLKKSARLRLKNRRKKRMEIEE